jgi:hypothetical protein
MMTTNQTHRKVAKVIPLSSREIREEEDTAVDRFAERDAVISEQIVVILKGMLKSLPKK